MAQAEAMKEAEEETVAVQAKMKDMEAHKATKQEALKETEEPLGSARGPGPCATSVARSSACLVAQSKISGT